MVEITNEQLLAAVRQLEKRKEYNKKRYYEKRYGITPPAPAETPIRTFKDATYYWAQGPDSRNGIAFVKGNVRVDGPQGWYICTGAHTQAYLHVSYVEDLLTYAEDEISDTLWRLFQGGDNRHYRTVAQAVREILSSRLTSYIHTEYFNDYLDHLTIGVLLERAFAGSRHHGHSDGINYAMRLYLESVNVISTSYYDGFDRTLKDVLQTARAYCADRQRRQNEINQRALQFRDMIAAEFGFKLTRGGHYARGSVDVFNDGSVHISGSYVCLVPAKGGHGDSEFPTGDIVAAKMLTLATGARYKVSTLRRHLPTLEKTFDGGSN